MICRTCRAMVKYDQEIGLKSVGSGPSIDEQDGVIDCQDMAYRAVKKCSECGKDRREFNFCDFHVPELFNTNYTEWAADVERPATGAQFSIEIVQTALESVKRPIGLNGRPAKAKAFQRTEYHVLIDAKVTHIPSGEYYIVQIVSEWGQSGQFTPVYS